MGKLHDIMNNLTIDMTNATLPERMDISDGYEKQIRDLMLETIGENYAHYRSKYGSHCPYIDTGKESDCDCGINAQNDLRDEWRQKVMSL